MSGTRSYQLRYDPIRLRTFQARLLRWFRRNGRDLPWRKTRDPYKILVSEVMLQQTQVDRVRGYYTRFLREYPTIRDLAAAPPARVRESWEGLGYYARPGTCTQRPGRLRGSTRVGFPDAWTR